MEFEGERYRYVHSLQGDIIAIVDSAGNAVVEYKYDAWGMTAYDTTIEFEIGLINPFRFRGYLWDMECQLYYLRRRYYNAAWSRFISRDSIIVKNVILQSNLWSYCANKPLLFKDPSGMKFCLIGDEQGYEILNHWLEGSGEELIRDSDAWGEYMREQEVLNETIEQEIYNAYKGCMNSNDGTYLKKITRSAELNRNTSLPYGNGYLHGTKYFHVTINARLNKQTNEFNFRVECEWEDTINPNYNYKGEKGLVKMVKLFFQPKDYKIRVRWVCDVSNFSDRFRSFFEKAQR